MMVVIQIRHFASAGARLDCGAAWERCCAAVRDSGWQRDITPAILTAARAGPSPAQYLHPGLREAPSHLGAPTVRQGERRQRRRPAGRWAAFGGKPRPSLRAVSVGAAEG